MNRNPFIRTRHRVLTLLAGAISILPLGAQTNALPARPDRFLFIVDTSAAMRKRAPAVEKAVENLLRSGMAAQLATGDTVGVWTFDEQLYAGRFPLQLWSPERADQITSNVLSFIKAQRYEKKVSNFDVVVPAMSRLVHESSRLTILLVSDGDEKITGTPFDQQIEAAFEGKFKEQQKARMPFVTVLRSMRGQFRNATVNLAPWPVEFPEFPPEPKFVDAPKPTPPEPKPTPRPEAPPLIVIGKKPTPPVATNATAVAPVPTTVTNPPVKVEATPPTITPTPPQLNLTEIKPEPAPKPILTPAELGTKPATPATVSTNLVTPAQTPVGATKPSEPVAASSTNGPAGTTSVTETKPATPTPVPPTNPPATGTLVQAPEVVPPAATNVATTEMIQPNPPPQVALAVQPEPGFSRMGLLAIAVALLLLAGGLFFVLQRRARHAAHPSLITRSMDRDQK